MVEGTGPGFAAPAGPGPMSRPGARSNALTRAFGSRTCPLARKMSRGLLMTLARSLSCSCPCSCYARLRGVGLLHVKLSVRRQSCRHPEPRERLVDISRALVVRSGHDVEVATVTL